MQKVLTSNTTVIGPVKAHMAPSSVDIQQLKWNNYSVTKISLDAYLL